MQKIVKYISALIIITFAFLVRIGNAYTKRVGNKGNDTRKKSIESSNHQPWSHPMKLVIDETSAIDEPTRSHQPVLGS